MKIVNVKGGEYPDVLGTYSKYEDYDDGSTDEVFMYGYNASRDQGIKDQYAHYKRKVYLNLEAPCAFFNTGDAITSQEYFDQVYTICPYTAEWLNGKGKTRYIPITEPYNDKYFTNLPLQKTKDVIYHGGLYSRTHLEMIEVMKGYNYVFCSLNPINATHINVGSPDKWRLIALSKCSVAINLLYTKEKHRASIKTYDNWQSNGAFKRLDVIPQSKARVVEAAACRTLNLVMRDDWNIIEQWFDRDEFIYWNSIEELKVIISDVKNNYHKYLPIIEKAYQKAQQYTVDKFIQKVLNENI